MAENNEPEGVEQKKVDEDDPHSIGVKKMLI